MARRRSKLDTEIQGLYGLPLGEFTAARNALAKRLRKEGDRDGAEEVAALPKPTVSAWAVNHLFTVEPERMEELLASGERAREALQEILSGGDPGALREAIQEARDLAADLRDRAVEALAALAADVRRPGPAIVDRITTNLQSLAFSPAAEPVIRRGWLDVDLPPPGFEVLAGLQLAALPERPGRAQPARPARPAPVQKPARDEARDSAAARRKEEQQEEVRARDRADREEARLRQHLARAQAEREEAAGRADFLRRKAEQAETVAEEARNRLAEAERISEEARKRAAEAKRALARAEKAVQTARRASGSR